MAALVANFMVKPKSSGKLENNDSIGRSTTVSYRGWQFSLPVKRDYDHILAQFITSIYDSNGNTKLDRSQTYLLNALSKHGYQVKTPNQNPVETQILEQN